MSRLSWTDPAPLEVERPRLPWWTMLPRKLLLAISPIIVLVTVVMVGLFLARRVWRYPLFLLGTTILAGLWTTYSWWVAVWLLACLGVGCGMGPGLTPAPLTGPSCGRSVRSGVAPASTPGVGSE
jgi:S-DNA-T family DNA segregation ATPase FtsK/SpoIIIE